MFTNFNNVDKFQLVWIVFAGVIVKKLIEKKKDV